MESKNHWTSSKIDGATKKINQGIYKRNGQAPVHMKMDDLSIFINTKITKRGIARGLVSIQENLNMNILEAEKMTIRALISDNVGEQYDLLVATKNMLKVEVWTDIRFLMVNKAITPGEITELIRKQLDIDKDIEKWLSSIQNAISAKR